jgi:hypothetical protein
VTVAIMGNCRRLAAIGLLFGIIVVDSRVVPRAAQGPASPQGPPQLQGPPTEITQVRFNSGQSVVPYFEGWIRNADGTFDLVFGYFNRNWKQELAIPSGPENKVEGVEGGGADDGQPTYFLPRRQRFVYRVRVPADFGKKEVVWTIKANGRTEQGFGNLLPAQEITERVIMTNGNFNPGLDDPNKPPSITIAKAQTATVDAPVRLVASVTDDGLPKPRAAPSASRPSAATGGQVNFGGQVDRSGEARPRGLRVSWLEYSGPGKVTFDEPGPIPVTNGQAATIARFAVPGNYRLVATANDGALSTRTELVVTVVSN